ncbi:hypothetical protein SDC9_173436 [bioreactor metagenome]|uniref:Uncharacterized protein n=1 Tax=bioreactor metagenome TaxID=1076179 RepID=A0A645GPX6_9ZZZZ
MNMITAATMVPFFPYFDLVKVNSSSAFMTAVTLPRSRLFRSSGIMLLPSKADSADTVPVPLGTALLQSALHTRLAA